MIYLLVIAATFGVMFLLDKGLTKLFRSREYRYGDIRGQKLYEIQGGTLLVELHMADGTAVSVQGNMEGAPTFLDKAAHARMRQLGLNSHECQWFDETEGRWFPPVED